MVAAATLIATACNQDFRRKDTVQVPDAFTAVVAHPISAPTFPFLGTDGK